ncbi:hypothetical protein Dimus_029595 [Dionaea muscipula]
MVELHIKPGSGNRAWGSTEFTKPTEHKGGLSLGQMVELPRRPNSAAYGVCTPTNLSLMPNMSHHRAHNQLQPMHGSSWMSMGGHAGLSHTGGIRRRRAQRCRAQDAVPSMLKPITRMSSSEPRSRRGRAHIQTAELTVALLRVKHGTITRHGTQPLGYEQYHVDLLPLKA